VTRLLGHQLGDRRIRVGGEAHVAVGEDAEELALLAALDHGDAGDVVLAHQAQGNRRAWPRDGW